MRNLVIDKIRSIMNKRDIQILEYGYVNITSFDVEHIPDKVLLDVYDFLMESSND